MKITALASWFGGKRSMAPAIVEQLGPHRAYVEPFCGSMAVLMAKPPCAFEMVSDLHGDLTNLAWTVQHAVHGPRLYRRLRRTLFSEATFAAAGERLASLPLAAAPETLDEANAERAYLWFVLCWMGRSGIIGTAGYNNCFTVRYTANGGNQATRFASAVEAIPAWRKRLRSVTVLRRDGFELLDRLPDEKGTAIYCDPPYLVKGAAYTHDFAAADHTRLAALLAKFRLARCALSYYAHPQLAELYPGWTVLDCSRTKHLSVQGKRGAVAKVAPEVLLLNREPLGTRAVEAAGSLFDNRGEMP